jgi:glycogen debranching enzyme
MDHDGLITGGVPGVQLTWMDAKVGDWVVTPRYGKPVEIQSLWIRALAIGEAFATKFGEPAYAARCKQDRAKAVASFQQRFWYADGGYLYDVIDGPEGNDASLRPNQLYALSLNDDLVSKKQAVGLLRLVEDHLLTPIGLRTLSPRDPRYRARYEGGVVERDGAYHLGTVWPFLLGPFVTAWIKTQGKKATTLKQARAFLDGIGAHLKDACLGQVSEIFDGESPHHARGCYAQAWSVAEPLRVLIEDLGIQTDAKKATVKRVVVRQRKEAAPPSTQQKKGKTLRRGRGTDTALNP